MKQHYIALMQWPERETPVCIGTDKEKVKREALRLLKIAHGSGPVERRGAFCSLPITADDILIEPIPFV